MIEVHGAPADETCARLLAEAFIDEPAMCWIAGPGQAAKYAWFAATTRAHVALPSARRYVAGDNGVPFAAALVTPPGTRPGVLGQLRWSARVAGSCGCGAIRRTLAYLAATEASKPDDAWTLEFIGVLPAFRGRGAARALLERILVDTAGHGIFLTTADAANASLYRHFGWRETSRLRIGPVQSVVMHRPTA